MSGSDSSLPPRNPLPEEQPPAPSAEQQPVLSAPGDATPASAPPSQLQFPPDIRTRWGWREILIFVFVTIGFYFAATIAVVVMFIATGRSVQELQSSARMQALFGVIATFAVSLGQLGFLYIFTERAPDQGFWRAIGWRPLRSEESPRRPGPVIYIAGGCIFAVIIGFASKFAGQPHGMPIEKFMEDRLSATLFLILGVTIAPFIEETVFRGFIYPVAARSFGIAGSIVFTGMVFGLLHGPQLWGAWAQIGLLIVVGIVFTAVRAKSQSVFASYLFHLGYNGWLFVAFLFASHFLKNLPGPQ